MPSETEGVGRGGRWVTAILVAAAVVGAAAAVLVFFIPTAGPTDASGTASSAPNSTAPTSSGASLPSQTPTSSTGPAADPPTGISDDGEPHLESIELFMGDTWRGDGNVYYPSVRRMDFRFWWIAYSATGPLDEGCTVNWRIERSDGSLVEKASYPKGDFSNGFESVTLSEGAYSLIATAIRDGYSSTEQVDFSIRPQ